MRELTGQMRKGERGKVKGEGEGLGICMVTACYKHRMKVTHKIRRLELDISAPPRFLLIYAQVVISTLFGGNDHPIGFTANGETMRGLNMQWL